MGCTGSKTQDDPASNDARCMCRPFKDVYLLTAQILSIVAFILSWVWYAPNIFALPVMICLQVIWCCKMSRGGVLATAILAAVTALLNFIAGLYILVAWTDHEFCPSWIFHYTYDDDYYGPDYCNEKAFAAIAFVDGILFVVVSSLLMVFWKRMERSTITVVETVGEEGPIPAVIASKFAASQEP